MRLNWNKNRVLILKSEYFPHILLNSAVMQIKNINTSYFLNCKGIYIGFPEHPEKKNETNKEHFSWFDNNPFAKFRSQ